MSKKTYVHNVYSGIRRFELSSLRYEWGLLIHGWSRKKVLPIFRSWKRTCRQKSAILTYRRFSAPFERRKRNESPGLTRISYETDNLLVVSKSPFPRLNVILQSRVNVGFRKFCEFEKFVSRELGTEDKEMRLGTAVEEIESKKKSILSLTRGISFFFLNIFALEEIRIILRGFEWTVNYVWK